MERIYHNHEKLEEHKHGMWKTINGEKKEKLIKEAVLFTSNYKLYGEWMMKVVREWKYSCEHNLSDININRQAWVGHAAVCLAIKCPEDITRIAWHSLTKQQQDMANLEADKAIKYWEENCQKDTNQMTFF